MQQEHVSKTFFFFLHTYLICFYVSQLANWDIFLNYYNVMNFEKYNLFNFLNTNKLFIYFSILISIISFFKSNKLFNILNFVNWLIFINITPFFNTPQEEFFSLMLICLIFKKMNTKSILDHIFMTTVGLSFFAISLIKIQSYSWKTGLALNSILHTPLSHPVFSSINIDLSLTFSYIIIFSQFVNIFLILPIFKLRRLILILDLIFFSGITLFLNLPSVSIGMMIVFFYLLIKNQLYLQDNE